MCEFVSRDVSGCGRTTRLWGHVCGGLWVRPRLHPQQWQVCGTERLWLCGHKWILSPCEWEQPLIDLNHIPIILKTEYISQLIASFIIIIIQQYLYSLLEMTSYQANTCLTCVFVCVIIRWGMTGTWRVVSRSVCVKVEVWSSVTTAAVNQQLKAASYTMENMTVAL